MKKTIIAVVIAATMFASAPAHALTWNEVKAAVTNYMSGTNYSAIDFSGPLDRPKALVFSNNAATTRYRVTLKPGYLRWSRVNPTDYLLTGSFGAPTKAQISVRQNQYNTGQMNHGDDNN
jgi:outer membrane lipoprotein-sorting protein